MSTQMVDLQLRVTLPVSRRTVVLNGLTGQEDQLLFESPVDEITLALALVQRVARLVDVPSEGADFNRLDWSRLTPTDLDFVILRLRQAILGDRVNSDVVCNSVGCGQRVDISFDIDPYLMHCLHEPAGGDGPGRAEKMREDSGWQRFGESDIEFRLPTVGDLIAVAGDPEAADKLSRRCIRPSPVSASRREEIESVIEAMAPSLSQELQGKCPECGSTVPVFFDARRYCLRELRDRAAFVYQDVDQLAHRYHWAESDILALPSARRLNYAAMARNMAELA